MKATEGILGSYFVPHYEGTLPVDELRSAMLTMSFDLLPLWINLKRKKHLLVFNTTLPSPSAFIFKSWIKTVALPAPKTNDLSILGSLFPWISAHGAFLGSIPLPSSMIRFASQLETANQKWVCLFGATHQLTID